MSYWFHRNSLKSTTTIEYDLGMVSAQADAIQICTRLKENRRTLITLFTDANNDANNIEQTLTEYVSLLLGFINRSAEDSHSGDYSKLRHIIKFKWTQTMLGNVPVVQQDTIFELISIIQEYGIWLMKNASAIAGKENLTMDDAKKIHTQLRRAAGAFECVERNYFDQLLEKTVTGSDMDRRVSTAYILQCKAEAQEVTLGRAIELKHSHSLIAALANETSKLYLSAAASIKALDPVKFGKWMRYFQLKCAIYDTYAYCFHGENLLSLEKCGEAVRSLQESEKHLKIAIAIYDDYVKQKGPGISAKIGQHTFFRSLTPLVKRVKDKCDRENGFIFHQKVAKDVPPIESKATHGLVESIDFHIPEVNKFWTPASYAAFDLTRAANMINSDKEKKKTKDTKDSEPIKPLKEVEINHTSKEPKNSSGCIVH